MRINSRFFVLNAILALATGGIVYTCMSVENSADLRRRDSVDIVKSTASPESISHKTPENFTVAFIGDQGAKDNSQTVLQLIKDEGAGAVVHAGDFDYENDPALWEELINDVLGPNFPYFAAVGNHDDDLFYGEDGYHNVLARRMNRIGIPWDGELGVKSSFVYNGIFVVLTAPDLLGTGHAEYIRDKLAQSNARWRISCWHKNMNAMQCGKKGDDTGWGVYEESRKGGAIIATGHEHSYSRTHLLSSCEHQIVASTSDTLGLAQDDPKTPDIDEGKSFVFVSGIAGKSIRNQDRGGPWWASVYTSDQGAKFGALFGVFNYQGNEGLARFYFKNIDGEIVDDFYVTSPSREEIVSLASGNQ
ncbi:MAG: metallophosphoesterase [Deferribacteres bacterium]|nr:metallophosphoesterase [candidate division KSB1 bacterium]MCB9511230.1 metallophosphoesterase [Deferribacteres bacterium]